MNTLLLTAALMTPAADLSGGYDKPAPPTPVAKYTAKGQPAEYQKCLEHVQTVGDCLLCVGMPADFVPKAYYTAFAVDKLEGFPAGVYLCSWPDHDKPPRIDRKTQYEPPAAQEVRPAATFPAVPDVRGVGAGVSAQRVTVAKTGSAVADHLCPNCHAGPWYAITGFNTDGTHSHRCELCGTVFSH